MPATDIVIKGAREHNLCNVDLVLPRNKLICLTGVSGSGKSSLAFDTLYAEGQRRYVESLSSFARQFLGQMPKPDVDFIGGLSPSISISQKSAGANPRSTVGTITEIYDYLRVLYARVADGHCPRCGQPITAQSREQILARILALPPDCKFAVLAPVIRGQKGEYRDLFDDLLKQGFVRARVDGQMVQLSDDLRLDRRMRHDIEVVVDRLAVQKNVRSRLAEALDVALKIGKGTIIVAPAEPPDTAKETESKKASGKRALRRGRQAGDLVLSTDYACSDCGLGFEPPSPQLFSFNSPQGMCLECDGLGEFYSFDPERLVPNSSLSFKQGCFELLGAWQDLGRWKRSIYLGVADTVERKNALPGGTLLETPWEELDGALQELWLWGTGDEHITYTWRGGRTPIKYGGTFEGIIPGLLSKYRDSQSRMHQRRLEKYMSTVSCPACAGNRLNPLASAFTVRTGHEAFAAHPTRSLPEVCRLPVSDARLFFDELVLDETRATIAREVLREIRGRLGFLLNVGLDYLALDRTAPTLSGGESQRIRLAGQVGCGLVGVLYILDEPSIGLHARDNDRLLNTLQQLRDLGNTVVVVEHDEDTMRAADHLIDFGPGPGVRGGQVVAEGPLGAVTRKRESVTGRFLAGKEKIDVPKKRRLSEQTQIRPAPADRDDEEGERRRKKRLWGPTTPTDVPPPPGAQWLSVLGASHNNLRHIDIHIPLGAFVCVTGVSGSGKSSLVNNILVEALRRDLNGGDGDPGTHTAIHGLQFLDKLIAIDQSPIGRTPRSNPGTYIKVFDDIRSMFTQLPESKRRGYKPGRFSFNVDGGRCQACDGNGSTRLEMDFLADVWVLCPVCEGHRFNRETLGIKYKGKSIADVLEMDIQEAVEFFENIPKIRHKLQTLHDVGLDYLKIGQPSPTLSGGEAQRVKLARELVKKSTGSTLYLLDEPTTGLHFADIKMLLKVLHDFVDAGNTVLVVEHNLEVIKTADWLIDLGPEGGAGGGEIVAVGTPEQVAREPGSYTGRALAPLLGHASRAATSVTNGQAAKSAAPRANKQISRQIVVNGASQHNLRHVDVRIPRDKMTVFCGPSGSGKSSLAMDTIYAEGQRRYVESLSAYARQFVGQMQKPQLEKIEGLSPAIAIEQQNLGNTPRSTVGTTTEIYDYLRIFMARLAKPFCPDCDRPIGTQTADEVVEKVMRLPPGSKLYLMAPVRVEVGQRFETLWDDLRAHGYRRVRIDGSTGSLDNPPAIDRRRQHTVEVVVDRVVVRDSSRSRIAEGVEAALAIGRGVLHVAQQQEHAEEPHWPVSIHSQHLACETCGRSFERLTPHRFSFNSHLGWCPACEGLGTQTGANPAALIRNGRLTLSEGAIILWPQVDRKISQAMLTALSAGTGVPIDVPFEELDGRQRRLILHGTEDRWYDMPGSGKRAGKGLPLFRFQFKGIYPALEEAARLSPALRSKLEHLVDEVECAVCGGSRLRDDAAAARFRKLSIDQICRQPLGQLQRTIEKWTLTSREGKIAGELLREIKNRLEFLNDVGLEYLTLARPAASLSGGEAQRIRLASQLGSGLTGVLYVLDEPTIGLHPRDNNRLIGAIHKLRDLGNTLLLVEHDREVIASSDTVLDFGPGAGKHGGQIVAQGSPSSLARRRASVTGPYLSGKKAIAIPTNRRVPRSANGRADAPSEAASRAGNGRQRSPIGDQPQPKSKWVGSIRSRDPIGPSVTDWLRIVGARQNNLHGANVSIPLGTLTVVTGVSGSGKSSLINDVLYQALAKRLHRASAIPGAHERIEGLEHINKVIRVDQQALGNTPTSNPATYTGVFELIRHLFAALPESKIRGFTARRFSFNVPGGRCDQCEGNGQLCIEMHFLPDVWVECETCRGKRYNPETLGVTFHGHSISDVLQMSCGDATRLFNNIPKIRRTLQTLCDVGLDYLTLGQAAPTLSGGEAQRVKLAAELSRPDTGRTLYLLDEPTTGLHFDDLAKLLDVLNRLVDLGNTVVVIEHNLDVIKTADWVIDLGPEAGEEGGQVVVSGTPEQVAEYGTTVRGANGRRTTSSPEGANQTGAPAAPSGLRSHTGEALAEVLQNGPHAVRPRFDVAAEQGSAGQKEIQEVGAETKMPWETNGRLWHTRRCVDRKGQPVRWDGRILGAVVDRIHEKGAFSDTDWNSRSIVEISAAKKSEGWFFHAITAETWLLKMKFRVARNTFKRPVLQEQLKLKTLNEMDDLPVYSNEPRVKCKNLRGPWQEVEIRAHSWQEINTPEFWAFVDAAVAGFHRYAERVAVNPEDVMPWKKLGRKWHFARKGFPPSQPPRWDAEVLEELCELLSEIAPEGQFLWNNQQLVHLFLPDTKQPWASLRTKQPEWVELALNCEKNRFALGELTEIGQKPDLDGTPAEHDIIRLRFQTTEQLHNESLREILARHHHAAAVNKPG